MTDESFLSRWSRLKRKEADPPEPAPPQSPEPASELVPDSSAGPAAEGADDAMPGAEAVPDLPPVDSLTAESDFTPFLRAGVPEDLHRQALRKLWTSDPVFANDDGLKDYADDYTGLFKGAGIVKTAYRVGKGFLDAAEEAAERAEEAAGHAAAAPAATLDPDKGPVAPVAAEEPEDPSEDGDMSKKT